MTVQINRTEKIWKHFKHRVAGKPTTSLRNEIAVEHQNIVRKIAHQVAARCRLSYEDLEQIGMIGVLKATEKFDPTKGIAFSSFATPYIRGEMLHHLRDSGSNVKVPRRARETNAKARKLARVWAVENNGQEPTEQQLAALMGVTVEKLLEARQAVAHQHACEFNEDTDDIAAPESYVLDDEQHQGLEQTWSQLRTRLQTLPNCERDLIAQTFCRNTSAKHLGLQHNMTATALQAKLERVLNRLAQ